MDAISTFVTPNVGSSFYTVWHQFKRNVQNVKVKVKDGQARQPRFGFELRYVSIIQTVKENTRNGLLLLEGETPLLYVC